MTDLHDWFTERAEEAIPEGDWVPALLAQKLVAQLNETEPERFAAWLQERAPIFVTDFYSYAVRKQRSDTRRQAFRSAVDAHEAHEDHAFDDYYAINDENVRRKVADMNGADHRYVAEQYEQSGRFDLLLAAFHRAVARRIGAKRTADVLSEAKYVQMYESIVRKSA